MKFLIFLLLLPLFASAQSSPDLSQPVPGERSLRIHSATYLMGSAMMVAGGVVILLATNEILELDSPKTVINAASAAMILGAFLQAEAFSSMVRDVNRRFKVRPPSQGLGLVVMF